MKYGSDYSKSIILACGVLLLLTASAMGGFILYRHMNEKGSTDIQFDTWINNKRDIFEKFQEGASSFDPNGDILVQDHVSRSGGGQLEWVTTLSEAQGEYLSSPLIKDLDGDDDYEIVIASAADYIYALRADGSYFWNDPYGDDIIDYLGQTAGTSGLDFDPPHIFANPAAADIRMDDDPEIIMGVKDGVICLSSEGEKQWKKGLTTGYYFSTACITDLEGEWSGNKEELEIVIASDDESRRGWIEAIRGNGSIVFRSEAPSGGEGSLIGCSMVAQDLDGDFWDGPTLIKPDETKETNAELLMGNHDRGLRIWERDGEDINGNPNYDEYTDQWLGGHQTYATHTVANVSGSPDCEIFTGSSEGYPRTWTGWGGKLYAYTPEGKKLWDFQTGSSEASIFSSPALGDIQMAKNDPDEKYLDYELVLGCDNGNIYVLNTEMHNLMWTFKAGERVRSSPAFCNIDNDDELEIIVASDSGKVFCFDGDPTDGIDEGIAYPGDSIDQDVLWVYDTKVPIGISSPAIGDIDLDGMLEVIIGDEEGNVYCISAGGTCQKGQMDWPEFHQNSNRTGFYNPQESCGVDIYPRKDPLTGERIESMSKIVKPGSQVLFNFTIENVGIGFDNLNKDHIYVQVEPETVPEGWKTYIDTPPDKGDDNPDYVNLASGQSANIQLLVTAPWEGELGESAVITVRCNSSVDRWVADTIITRTVLDTTIDYELAFDKFPSMDPLDPLYDKKWDRIEPGGEKIYPGSLLNTGMINDTYQLRLSTPPKYTGWDWYFMRTGNLILNLSLSAPLLEENFGGFSKADFSIKVLCPKNASKDIQIPVILKGLSTRSQDPVFEEIVRSDELVMIVGEHIEVELSVDEDLKMIGPNSTVEFVLHVTNLGNKDMINVLLFVEGKQPGWAIRYQEEPIAVYQGQTKNVMIRILGPGYISADKTMTLRICGMSEGGSQHQSEAIITLKVKHIYDFSGSILDEKRMEVDPGDETRFRLHISNHGNGEDSISLNSIDVPDEWKLDFLDLDGAARNVVYLNEQQSMILEGRIMVPDDASTGLYGMGITLNGIESSMELSVSVFVNQTYDISIGSMEELDRISSQIRPGQEKRFIVQVSNNGNGRDTARIEMGSIYDPVIDRMSALPYSWEGKFVAVSNSPNYTSNIRVMDFRDRIPISNQVADVFYAPNNTVNDTSVYNTGVIRNIELIIEEGQTAWIHVSLKSPRTELESTETTDIMISARGGGDIDNWDRVTIEFEIQFPDIVFVYDDSNNAIGFSGGTGSGGHHASAGDVLTIIVKIRNTGDIPAEKIDVLLNIDGEDRKVKTIESLVNGNDAFAEKTVIFSWVAEAGSHKIKVILDPADKIVEIPEGELEANEVTRSINVEGSLKIKSILSDNPIISTMLIIILTAVILVGVALLIRSTKKN